MTSASIPVRALQLGDRIDLKGLEREDAFSNNPLAFNTASGATAVLFKSGAVVFINMNPIEEEELIRSLAGRVSGPTAQRESETARYLVKAGEDEIITAAGVIQVKAADPDHMLLIAEALATSVALALDERRITAAFERVTPVAESLKNRRLPPGPRAALWEQIGEALLIQQRLAGRVDLDDKPDVLWDHPELERFWAKLVDEYDLQSRSRAIGRKLEVLRETSDTITDLVATRTSHRLEWYIIVLIAIDIVVSLYAKIN